MPMPHPLKVALPRDTSEDEEQCQVQPESGVVLLDRPHPWRDVIVDAVHVLVHQRERKRQKLEMTTLVELQLKIFS